MFVASHKHEHLKGLTDQGGPLPLLDVLALAEEPLHSSTGGDLTKSWERSSHQLHSICLVDIVQAPFHKCLCGGTKSVILQIHVHFCQLLVKVDLKNIKG